LKSDGPPLAFQPFFNPAESIVGAKRPKLSTARSFYGTRYTH
jgi:hypothetical protein